MIFRVDPQAPEPLFEQLGAQVRAAVAAGQLVSGDRLPAARALAESLDINVHTVLHAYQSLRDDGLIELRRGRGAVVSAPPAPALDELRAAIDVVVDRARTLGVPPTTTLTLLKEALR